MVLIDTSVWIQYFRGNNPKLVEQVRILLDQDSVGLAVIVWLELLSGAKKTELRLLRRVLSAFPRYYPTEETWVRIEEWIEKSALLGHRFGVADLTIAAIAAQENAEIWSLDSDFRRMHDLKFVRLLKVN